MESKLNQDDFPDIEFRFDQEKYITALISWREKLRDRREVYKNDKILVTAIDVQINEVNIEIQQVND